MEFRARDDARRLTLLLRQVDHAIAYADFFWPDFAIVDDHVLRAPVTAKAFTSWRKQCVSLERHQREALYNRIYIDDILFQHEEWTTLTEERSAYVGRVLAEMHEAKLARNFPDRRFVVEFCDGSQPEHGGDVSMSFWQQP